MCVHVCTSYSSSRAAATAAAVACCRCCTYECCCMLLLAILLCHRVYFLLYVHEYGLQLLPAVVLIRT